MYAPELTQRTVEEASKRLGFDLTYHSVAQIAAARTLLDGLLDLERGGLKRPLAPDEQRFITNERTLCLLDARYYYRSYATIINYEKQPELFTPNIAQGILIDIWADLERQGRAIHILELKARRLGVSTLSELEIARRVQFVPFTNAVVASADPTKSVVMADMIDFNWRQMPWWLMPSGKGDKVKHGMPVEFAALNSGITIQAGNQFNGVARGATPNLYHVSEIAEWVNAESLIDASLLRAIIDTPQVFGIIEGTGEGKGTYFHQTWELAKREWPRGRGRQMPVFLPWYVGTDIYPSEAEQRARPIPAGWTPSDKTIAHAERARTYVLANPLLFQHLAKGDRDWQMPRAQMWYREVEYESAREKKTLNRFLSEMCVVGDARVSTEQGIVRLDDAADAICTDTGNVLAWHDNGERYTVEVETKQGRLLRLTGDHLVGLDDGTWRSAGDLHPGDTVQLLAPSFAATVYTHTWAWTPRCEMRTVIDETWARFLGFFVGDGCWRTDGVSIACFSEDLDVIEECANLTKQIVGTAACIEPRKGTRLVNVNSNNVRWREMLRSLGAIRSHIHKKENRKSGYVKNLRVPEAIWRSPKPVVRAFLQGLFESDGHANRSAPQVTLFSKSSELIREIQLLLLGFGINAAHMSSPKIAGDGHVYEGRCLRLNALNAQIFYEQIGFVGARKRAASVRQQRAVKSNAAPLTMTDTVVGVKSAGRARVYDLTVADAHCYAANGILVHNCGDDFEAFQAQNLPIIDPEIVQNYRERTRAPIAVYTIVGPDIPPHIVAPRKQWDRSQPTITIDTRPILPQYGQKFQLIPLKFEGYDRFDEALKLLVWERPSDTYTYGVGVDCSEGVGQDNGVIEVLRESTLDREPGQVAELATNLLTAFQMWPLALAIATWYSVFSERAQRRIQTRLAIEAWTNGSALQNELQKRGWSNFHPWQYNDARRPKPANQTARVGVFTNQWFRSNMLDMLLTCLSEEAIDLPSPYLIDELETLERLAGQKKIAAQYGQHDDRVMAIGFPLFSLHQHKPPTQQFARKRVAYAPGLEEDLVTYPVWGPPQQALSLPAPMAGRVFRTRGRLGIERGLNMSLPKGYR